MDGEMILRVISVIMDRPPIGCHYQTRRRTKMKRTLPPSGTEDETYHWVSCTMRDEKYIGLWSGRGWTIPGYIYEDEPINSDEWEYLGPVPPYVAP